jgi:hypothetical protein
MQEQAKTIRDLQRKLQQTQHALNDSTQNQSELNSLLHAAISIPGSIRGPTETPGPHRLLPKGQRQEDKGYLEKIRQQQERTSTPTPPDLNDPGLLFIKTLAKAITDNHHNDMSEPIKFTGQDLHWDEF